MTDCYSCGRKAVVKNDVGIPLCTKCYTPPTVTPTPMPAKEEPLRFDDVDTELDRLRKELGWQFEDEEKRTPTLKMEQFSWSESMRNQIHQAVLAAVRAVDAAYAPQEWKFKSLAGVEADDNDR